MPGKCALDGTRKDGTQQEPIVSGPEPQLDPKTKKFRRGNAYRYLLGQGGRKKGAEDRANKLSAAYGEMLQCEVAKGELTNAEAIARRMIDIAITGKPGAAVNAAKELADRSEGKPMQAIQISQVMDEDTAKRLVEIGDLIQRFLPKPVPVLEATVVDDGLVNRTSE
jgi:hypothetical protein